MPSFTEAAARWAAPSPRRSRAPRPTSSWRDETSRPCTSSGRNRRRRWTRGGRNSRCHHRKRGRCVHRNHRPHGRNHRRFHPAHYPRHAEPLSDRDARGHRLSFHSGLCACLFRHRVLFAESRRRTGTVRRARGEHPLRRFARFASVPAGAAARPRSHGKYSARHGRRHHAEALPSMVDIANTAVFLASDLARSITGVTVDVTAGTTAGLNHRAARADSLPG